MLQKISEQTHQQRMEYLEQPSSPESNTAPRVQAWVAAQTRDKT